MAESDAMIELIQQESTNIFNQLSRESQMLVMKVAEVAVIDVALTRARVRFPTDPTNLSSWYYNRSGSKLYVGQKVYIYHKYGDIEQGFIEVGGDNVNIINSGYTGSQGIQGYTGSLGFTGSTGAGYTGSQGVTGFVGSVGYTGSRGAGYTGSQGITGYTGSLGYTGSQGAGYTGSQGTTGYTGSTFYVSSSAPSNPAPDMIWVDILGESPAGYTGSQGYTGSRGLLGYTGSTGAGYTGSQGYTGSAGTITEYTKYLHVRNGRWI
jgi:hypothetical protein